MFLVRQVSLLALDGTPGLGLPLRYSDLTLMAGQPGEPGILASGDDVDVSAALSPGGGKFIGEGDASFGCISNGEPADPRDTGESGDNRFPLLHF